MLDLRFQALPDEITTCHSSLGGEFGEVDSMLSRMHSTGSAGASEARVLDNIESTSPIMPAVE